MHRKVPDIARNPRRPVARTRAQVYRTHAGSPRAASDFVGTKRVAQPDEPAGFERDHVETARGLIVRTAAMNGQIMLRRAHDAPLLTPVDARRRAAELSLRPRADLDEHQRTVTVAHNQIDLAAAARHVTRDEPQTLPLQKLLRPQLENRADEFGPGRS